jgi:CO/xanthine dehydrogenase Mo-binding subunit
MGQPVGKPIERFDSYDKVTGRALFPGDINFPNQVFMRTLFSPSPHAIIRQIEFTNALKVPGVIAVLTAEDVPYGPMGARGMGEMPFVPFAPAFTSAVHDAVGIWFDQIPLLMKFCPV